MLSLLATAGVLIKAVYPYPDASALGLQGYGQKLDTRPPSIGEHPLHGIGTELLHFSDSRALSCQFHFWYGPHEFVVLFNTHNQHTHWVGATSPAGRRDHDVTL